MLVRFAIPLRKIVNFFPKAKLLRINLKHSLPFVLLLMASAAAFGQGDLPNYKTAEIHVDTTQNPLDSIPPRDTVAVPVDTLQTSDTTHVKADTVPPPSSDIKTTINYSARDSIFTSVDGKKVWLYGNAKIQYGAIELDAEQIEIDYATNTLIAHGRRDSLGNRVGYPTFKNGGELYETKDIVYNFKTGKARISEVDTKQGDGYLHGKAVYKTADNELYSRNNSYTTCDLENPHYRIIASKTKAIPNDKIVAGPFYMEFDGVPTPIGFLFGMFPAQQTSKSGLIFPSYGEEKLRGFNLRGGGYFFDISDYTTMAVTSDIYSKGGFALYDNTSYAKRYHYTGGINFSYTKNRIGKNIENKTFSNDYRLQWTHSPTSTGRTSRFSASVSAATSSYTLNNNLYYGQTYDPTGSTVDNYSRKLTSNVSYSKSFAGTPFSLGLNLNHTQDISSKEVTLLLPSFNFNMNNIYPLQHKDGSKRGNSMVDNFMDNLNMRYTMTAVNNVSNHISSDSIAPFNFQNLHTFLQNGKKGVRHDIPLSTSFRAFKYFTASPSLHYNELWFDKKLIWGLDENNSPVPVDTVGGFHRLYTYDYSIGFSTRIYGMFLFKKGNLKAIRHVMNPAISFGYQPDFTTSRYDYLQKITTLQNQTYYKSRYEGFVYQPDALNKSGSIGLSLNNNLEAKVHTPKDSVDRKVTLLNSLSMSTAYNIVADSFKLSSIHIGANTSIFNNRVNLNMSGTVDPYVYLDGKRYDEYSFQHGSLGRLTNASLSMNMNLNPAAGAKEQQTRNNIQNSSMPESEKEYYLSNPNTYVDFNIPWSMNLNFNIAYNRPTTGKSSLTENLQASGDLSLTDKWKVTYTTSYDFANHQIARLDLNIMRDLHCWTMDLTWTPVGRYQSYYFTIRVKASVLQDLKIERRKPFFDNL